MYKTLRFTLVSLLMMLCGTVFAQDETIDFSSLGYTNAEEVATVKGTDVTLTLDKGTNNNTPKYYSTGTALRLYGGNTMTVSSTKTIEKVVFTFNSTYNLNDPTVSEGSYDSDKSTWTGSASEFTITRGGTSGHARIQKMEFYFADGQTDNRQGTYMELGEHATTGVIGGSMPLPTVGVKNETGAPINNLTIAWESTNTEVATIGNGVINFNAVGTTTIKAAFAGDNTYKPCNASFNLTITEAPYTSIAAMLADITSNRTTVTYQFENLLVTYVNSNNTYVSDGQNGFLFYGSNLGLNAGEIISGSAVGQLYTYNGLPELAVSAEGITKQVVSQDNVVTWTAIAPADIQNNINLPVLIENAVFVGFGSGKNLVFKVNGEELAVYNNWEIDKTGLEANMGYTLKGIGGVYAKDETTTYQLYLVSYESLPKKNVYFSNTAKWNAVYVWAWNDTENFTGGEWPGKQLTANDQGYYIWSTTGDPTKIIFSDGGNNQTADLEFEDGAYYTSEGKVVPPHTYTATFTTDLGWNEVWAYVWTETDTYLQEFVGSFPGEQLTKDDASGNYLLSFESKDTPEKILFSNGIIEGEGKAQTADLEFEDGKAYSYTQLDIAKAEFEAFIAEVEALYNQHKDDVPAESQAEVEQAIQDAKDALNSPNATVESLAQAQADLQAAMMKARSDALGLDVEVTDKFDIEYNWISEMGEVTVNKDNDLSQVLMNTTDGTGKVIYKTVTGLQNGTYDVKLEGGAIDDGTGTRVLLHDGEEGRVVLFANNVALSLPVRFSDQNSGTQHMELKNVVVSDGTMELGMQKLAPGSNWHLINIKKVKMLSYTKQVADEDGQNADWQVVKKTILDDQSYSSVTDEPRETLQAADTKADIMAAIPAFYAAYVPVQSEDVYSVAGEPADLFGYYWNEKATETEMTLNKDGLYEWSKENVTLAGGAKVEFKVVKNHDWAEAWPSSNYKLEIPENGKYTVVITFDAASETVNATATKTGDATIENAEITSVELRGDFSDWGSSTDFTLVKSETADNVWTMTLNLTEMTYDPKFKLVVNGSEWIGNNQMEIVAPDKWVDSAYNENNDLILYHTNTGYNTYTVTATWDPNANADQGWTLTFAGKDAKTPVEMQDFSIIFTTNADWEEVYAYAWSGEGTNVNEILGTWPGTKMSYNERYTQYELSFQAAEAPQWIIFNNGKGGGRNQTENLVFENEKTYQHTVDADSELMAEAKRLAADADAVAVGKLIDAIDWANANNDESQLQDAIDAFNANNADQEKDETAKVATNGWKKFTGNEAAGICATQYAPAIDTYDGRKSVQMAEVWEGTCATTGQIIYQNITGLTNGSYKVGFYANAFSTAKRDGMDCDLPEEGADDVAYVFANDEKAFVHAIYATATEENSFRQFDVEVTDGNIKLGMGKEKAGSNWHIIQIYQLTWFTTAKEVYATDKAEMQNLLDEARVLLKDENKYEGKEELSRIIAESEQVLESNWYNIPEFEDKLQNLKDAIESYKFINRYINLAAGEYYIIDAESGKKMAAGHDWGTRGIVNEQGLDLTLTPYEDSRTVTIDSRVSNGGNSHFLGSNLYMDSSSWGWALEYQGFGFYILEPKDGKYINIDANDNLVLSDTPREFIIVTKDGVKAELLEEMATATAENPVDATFLITAPNFNRNDARNSAWNKYQGVSGDGHTTNISGGNNVNNCAEAYHTDFSLDQVLEDAPAGIYKLTAQGFYRQDGEETEDAPVFIIGAGNHTETGAIPVKTGNENNMSTASESFTAGNYTIEPIEFKYYGNEELCIGVEVSGVNQWVIFDNFQLTYYGPFEATYTVAGAFKAQGAEEETAEIFGDKWNVALEANDMVKGDDGIYTKTFEDVELPAGTIYYKVVANHSWNYASWGFDNDNADYMITEKMLPAGLEKAVFDITFKFNPSQKLENGYNLTCEVVLDEITTGIMNVNHEAIKNGNVYNLNGQKVNKIQKGLYIVNGKKVVRK